MGDFYYKTVRFFGRHPFWISSRPIVMGLENIPPTGALLIAANHESPFDVALMIRHVPRLVDFVSITEVFENPIVGWFYGSMNAFPLDRSKRDTGTIRIILDRLARGRVVGMFPEGGLRPGAAALVHTRRIRPGIGKIARAANAPIVPCIIVNSVAYWRAKSWLPLRRTRYAIAFGAPISPTDDPAAVEAELLARLLALHESISAEFAGASA